MVGQLFILPIALYWSLFLHWVAAFFIIASNTSSTSRSVDQRGLLLQSRNTTFESSMPIFPWFNALGKVIERPSGFQYAQVSLYIQLEQSNITFASPGFLWQYQICPTLYTPGFYETWSCKRGWTFLLSIAQNYKKLLRYSLENPEGVYFQLIMIISIETGYHPLPMITCKRPFWFISLVSSWMVKATFIPEMASYVSYVLHSVFVAVLAFSWLWNVLEHFGEQGKEWNSIV